MNKKILFLFAIAMVIFSCEKTPDNPYDNVNYDTDTTTTATADPNTIVGLHRNVFFPRCAKSGCHDGTFEPDYRTVMSTYSTLVYQPVIKSNADAHNLFLTDNRVGVTYEYRIQELAPSGSSLIIRGNLDVVLNTTAITNGSNSQNVTYSIYVKDRAGNQSNTVTTSDITIHN